MKKAAIVFVLLVTVVAQANEFWLRPDKFRYAVGEEMKADFLIGENFSGEFWDSNVHKIEKAEVHFAGGATNLISQIKPTKREKLTYKFLKEGTHTFALQSDEAITELESEKFDVYLEENGLDEIKALRSKVKDKNAKVIMYDRMYAKLIVQAGSKTNEVYGKRAGFRLEIIPLSNPYVIKSGDYLDCRVLYEGKPGKHQLVKVWSHVGNRTFLQNIYTENDGTIKFPISSSGAWMVSADTIVPSEKAGADYQSIHASLVFGIE